MALEVCPVSNVALGVYSDLTSVPLPDADRRRRDHRARCRRPAALRVEAGRPVRHHARGPRPRRPSSPTWPGGPSPHPVPGRDRRSGNSVNRRPAGAVPERTSRDATERLPKPRRPQLAQAGTPAGSTGSEPPTQPYGQQPPPTDPALYAPYGQQPPAEPTPYAPTARRRTAAVPRPTAEPSQPPYGEAPDGQARDGVRPTVALRGRPTRCDYLDWAGHRAPGGMSSAHPDRARALRRTMGVARSRRSTLSRGATPVATRPRPAWIMGMIGTALLALIAIGTRSRDPRRGRHRQRPVRLLAHPGVHERLDLLSDQPQGAADSTGSSTQAMRRRPAPTPSRTARASASSSAGGGPAPVGQASVCRSTRTGRRGRGPWRSRRGRSATPHPT